MNRGFVKNIGNLTVNLPSDREIVLTRIFKAPRQLVYEAFRNPEILKRWFGPRGWSLVTCDVDARVGGGFRFVLRHADGRELGMRGAYQELSPERSIHTEWFDDFPGEAQVTSVLTERDGHTTLVATILYPSRDIRDAVLQSGMEHGAAESYDKLEEILAKSSCSTGSSML